MEVVGGLRSQQVKTIRFEISRNVNSISIPSRKTKWVLEKMVPSLSDPQPDVSTQKATVINISKINQNPTLKESWTNDLLPICRWMPRIGLLKWTQTMGKESTLQMTSLTLSSILVHILSGTQIWKPINVFLIFCLSISQRYQVWSSILLHLLDEHLLLRNFVKSRIWCGGCSKLLRIWSQCQCRSFNDWKSKRSFDWVQQTCRSLYNIGRLVERLSCWNIA